MSQVYLDLTNKQTNKQTHFLLFIFIYQIIWLKTSTFNTYIFPKINNISKIKEAIIDSEIIEGNIYFYYNEKHKSIGIINILFY